MFKNKAPRIYLIGGYYFVTVKTHFNKPIFCDQNLAKIFSQALKFLKQRGDFELIAGVLLPDHFHLLLKPKKKNISEIMHDLKSFTAQEINNHYRQGILTLPDCNNTGEASSLTCKNIINLPSVWQRSFYYHIITSENDFSNHYNYIAGNPQKHRYISINENWPWLWFG
ncbi:MAG: transposase [Patescibacteria group bacterium]